MVGENVIELLGVMTDDDEDWGRLGRVELGPEDLEFGISIGDGQNAKHLSFAGYFCGLFAAWAFGLKARQFGWLIISLRLRRVRCALDGFF
jgi:hypothetical protein